MVALDHAEGAFSAGQVMGLVGKNGAGKSTLIKVLAGATQPDEGEVLVDGEPTAIHNPHHATELGLAFVHQELADVPKLTVAENVELGLGYPKHLGVWLDRRGLRAKVREVLDRLGAEGIDPKAQVGSLSVADQRMVMIARGMAVNARLLVLDEPSASLSNEEIEQLHRVVRGLAETGVGVVYVTHRLDEIFQITDWVTVMRDGKVVLACPTDDLNKPSLIAHITGSAEVAPEKRERAVTGESAGRGGPARRGHQPARRGRRRQLQRPRRRAAGHRRPGRLGPHRARARDRRRRPPPGRARVRARARGADPQPGRQPPPRRRAAARGPAPPGRGARLQRAQEHHAVGAAELPPGQGGAACPRCGASGASARDLVSAARHQGGHIEQPVRFLSGGNQQKVVLAKWLESGADVFIFDEPTHGIDVEGKDEVYRLMEELALAGHAVIFISSEFTELVGACNRVLVMREGRLVGELEGDDVTDQALVERCYEDAAA